MSKLSHTPVLLDETLDLLNLRAGSNVVDCTLGLGGHSIEILKRIAPEGRLMGLEADEANLEIARERIRKEGFANNAVLVHTNFEHLKSAMEAHYFSKPDAILFDLGLSSPHVDDADRGFAFKKEGPLDMRFDRSTGFTAEYVVNHYNETDLADVIYQNGEEPRSRVIAKAIITARKEAPIKTTTELAEIVKGATKRKTGIHPATLTFQGLRIHVNRELEVLESALNDAVELTNKGARIAVISYHSLEDRIVKNVFRHYSKNCICPKEIPICQCEFRKKLYLLTKRPIIPNGIEVEANPRARSAKLRAAERI